MLSKKGLVIANSGPLSLEKLMLCKSTDKMHSFNRRLSTQVCSCKKIKTLLSVDICVHDNIVGATLIENNTMYIYIYI